MVNLEHFLLKLCYIDNTGAQSTIYPISVLVTFQIWWSFSFSDISVLVTFQFWWHFSLGDIVPNMWWICCKYVLYMLQICCRYVADMSQICHRYAQIWFKCVLGKPQICPWYVPDISQMFPDISKHLLSDLFPIPRAKSGDVPSPGVQPTKNTPNSMPSRFVQSMAGLSKLANLEFGNNRSPA